MFLHLAALVRLTISTFVSRVGLHLLTVGDALIVGRHSVDELAWIGAATAVASVLYILAPGLLIGTLVETSAARARGQGARIGDIWRVSVVYGIAAGVVCGLLCLSGPWLLGVLDQDPAVAREGGRLLAWMGMALPVHFAMFATLYVLEASGRAQACAIAFAVGAVANVGIDIVLVFDEFAGLGADGAVIGTALVRLAIFTALALVLWHGSDAEVSGIRRWRFPARAVWRSVLRIGFASGASLASESAAFAALTIFAGWLGPASLAVYTILFNILSTIFMMALALGVATSVQVATARECSPIYGPKQALAAALMLCVGLMGLFGGLAWLFAPAVAAAFTSDSETAAAAAALTGWLAVFLLIDGAQVTIHHGVRGLNDAWVTTAINLVCYLVIMTGAAWLLAIPVGQGVAGLFQGGLIAGVCVVLLLLWRFETVRRRVA
jgi:MATE family multidrug resistance protein